jgi:oligopeptide/dipeptide ABC transporter ATP-binding protein
MSVRHAHGSAGAATSPCLEVLDLVTSFHLPEGIVRAVDGISFHVEQGEILGLVGESGCGKSVTALSVLRLLPKPSGEIMGGEIRFRGLNLLGLSGEGIRKIRGNRIAMIFQEPMTSLNPVYTVGRQIAEIFIEHQGVSRKEAVRLSLGMLEKVQMPAASTRIHEYPHQMSGGMRQRVMIAMALACNPALIIADEPTTALDVTIQAEILDLIADLQRDTGTSVLLITHNLGLVAQYARRVMVMYAGRIVEEAPVEDLFERPLHPYTLGLLSSIPRLGRKAIDGKRRLSEIPGVVPELSELPTGCGFHPRCPKARSVCRETSPRMIQPAAGRRVCCLAVEQGWQ